MGITANYNWNIGMKGQNPWWDEWSSLWTNVDTELFAVRRKTNAWVDVTDFMDGLSGRPTYATWYANQATTDTLAVWNTALASGAKTIIAPDGHYKITGTIVKPDGVNLFGTSRRGTIIEPSAQTFPAITVSGSNTQWEMGHFTINYGVATGDTSATNPLAKGITLLNSGGGPFPYPYMFSIRDVSIFYSYDGLYNDDYAFMYELSNIYVASPGHYGVNLPLAHVGTTITMNNVWVNGGNGGFRIFNVSCLVMNNCGSDNIAKGQIINILTGCTAILNYFETETCTVGDNYSLLNISGGFVTINGYSGLSNIYDESVGTESYGINVNSGGRAIIFNPKNDGETHTGAGSAYALIGTNDSTSSAEEGFEIVRRRLFEPIVDSKLFVARDATAKAFMDLYRTQQQEFPPECREGDYEKRLKAAYPIHPEVFDRLYNDWSTLVKFQRTRGVLRLMAAVIHSLWEKDDRNPLILPANIPMDDPRVQFELTRYLPDNWVPVIEKDVDGPNSLPLRLDGEKPNLGSYSACRRVARTVYLGSAPTAEAANRGLEDRRIKLGCVQPGERRRSSATPCGAWPQQATYLYVDGARYWYSTQPTVTKLADDRAEQFKARPGRRRRGGQERARAGRETARATSAACIPCRRATPTCPTTPTPGS